jgi:aspartate aminotransferase
VTISARVRRVQQVSRRTDPPFNNDLIELSKGEPDLDTPQVITQAMVDALSDGWTHYVNQHGDPELRRVLVEDANGRYGTAYGVEDCLITHGGAAAITATMLALINHGDTVVTTDPTYSLYRDAIALAGGTLVTVEVQPGDEVGGLARLARQAVEAGAAMVVVCNPVNPSGAVYSAEAMAALADGLAGTDVLVLADEAYEAYIYADNVHATALSVPDLRERLIFCQTFSKTYAMTGWRIGYIFSHEPETMRAISDVHKTFNGSLNAAVQRAAIVAVRTRNETIPAMLNIYRERRSYVMERLAALPGVTFVAPLGAFYVFFEYDYDIPSEELRDRLIEEYGVGLRPGSEFGDAGERRLRLSYTYGLQTLSDGLDRLELAFTTLAAELVSTP